MARRARACDKKSKGLWPKGLALTASSTSGTRQKDQSYAQKVLSFRVDHQGDPPNTPRGIGQHSIGFLLTPYTLSAETLYPFSWHPIPFQLTPYTVSRFVHRRHRSPLFFTRMPTNSFHVMNHEYLWTLYVPIDGHSCEKGLHTAYRVNSGWWMKISM